MASNGWTSAADRVASVMARMLIALLVIVPVAAVVWFAAFYVGVQGREVGPGAEEMAEDPVLHVEIANTSPGEIHASTGEEGGIAPGFANSISSAHRDWALNTADWQGALVGAVEDVHHHRVTWWSLSCSTRGVVFSGRTEIEVGNEVLFAMVDVGVYEIDADAPFLRITLSSDGIDRPGPGAPSLPEPRMDDGCPPAVSEAFASLRA